MNEMIENKTFDEIRVGDTASLSRTLHSDDGQTWAALTGDVSLIDLDPSPADSSMFPYGGGRRCGRQRCSRRSPERACRVWDR